MTSITIPATIEYIEYQAFSNCPSLTTVSTLKNVISIEVNTFYGCSSLTTVGSLDNVTSIGSSAFRDCSSLTTVGSLENVTSIGSSAFRDCSSLTTVGSLENVTSIGNYAFSGCSSLTFDSFDFFKNFSTIGEGWFNGCESITELTIPACITSIGNYAFSHCTGLKKVIIEDSDNEMAMGYGYSDYNNSGMFHQSPIETLYLGRNLNYTLQSDYWSCNAPFEGITALKSITFGSKVTKIGERLFNNCTGIETLTIPANILEIGNNALAGNFPTYTFLSSVPAIVDNAFGSNSVLIVPDAYYAYYYNAWANHRTQIISDAYPTTYEVEVSAKNVGSDVLDKIGATGEDDTKIYSVINLKVKGTINSYDIMIMRNKMLNLRSLDLSEASIVANAYEYYQGYHSLDNVVSSYSFYNLNKLREVKLPNTAITIEGAAFSNCSNLETVVLGEETLNIEDGFYPYNGNYYDYLGAFRECNICDLQLNDKLESIGSYAFYGNKLENLVLSQNVKIIGEYTFAGSSIKSVILNESLQEIGSHAFAACSNLKNITFSPGLQNINPYAFESCNSLESVMLPPTLRTIDEHSFSGCYALTELRIPESIETIGDYAFEIPNISDIYTWTIEPTNINQNTFDSSLYTKTKLHVPETSKNLYYWDTQWSQFQTTAEFNEPYTYFYLKNKDLEIDESTPRLEGESDGDNPDADLKEGSGLIVEGDESQNLGETTIESNGNDTAASIIGGESGSHASGNNVNIDDLTIKINITANKWYFFAFPFDINYSNMQFDGQFVWRFYDGEYRALQGNGAWKNHTGKLEAGKGYIFQGSKSGILKIHVGKASIGGKDKMLALETHNADNAQNASWNLVGNPFTSYYNISDMNYSAPITIWNGTTYQALSPEDDDYTLYPYQAFFVQKPEADSQVGFEAINRLTKNQRDDKAVLAAAKMRRLARASNTQRNIINIEVTNGTLTDKTRVVFNEEKSCAYELECDAAKFVSDSAPQIYTIDATNVEYSINERPVADGAVRLGFIANESGSFTITATRLDVQTYLKDLETGKVCDLTSEKYEFTADAGINNDRFLLINGNVDVNGINDAAIDEDKASYYGINGMKLAEKPKGMSVVKKGAKVEKVYNK